MSEPELAYLTPEARARVQIDRMLAAASWAVQDYSRANLSAARGVAVREFVLAPPHGRADYLLFVDGEAVGVIEAKKEGETLTGVAWQTAKYVDGLPDALPTAVEGALPFAYQSTGAETRFTNTLDPDAKSRQVFWFHRSDTLARWIGEIRAHPRAPTLRHRLSRLPPLADDGLWPAQARAIRNLERSLAADRPRALIQMATGSGKTFMAANIAYRLVRFADARRILFLVDRANLGRQTLKEFQGFTTPDDGRKLTELYNVQHLGANTIDPVARVTISTIQRLYSTLRGEPDLDPELDERSGYDLLPSQPVRVAYSPTVPIETFDDSHADDIVQIVRDEFGKGDDFAVKITYKSTGRRTDDMIAEFRNSYSPRIAVTMDMIATGTDVRPLECVFFMRSVRSRTYFEQMKGRGVRVIGDTDFQAVTPDALAKERFVIVDAVGVTETDLVDTQPLDRKPTEPLHKLLRQISFGVRDPDAISTVAARLARLDRRLTKEDREELEGLAGGQSLAEITRGLVEALDPDRHVEETRTPDPTPEEVAATAKELIDAAVAPLATNPELRERIIEVRRSYEQAIDETSLDEVIGAGYSKDAADRARATVESFERFIEGHKDEITALQILYSRPHAQRLTFREVKELANAIGRPPHRWTPERLWAAYEALDRSKVRGSGQRVLTDIVSLVRFALHQEGELVPYPERVRERFDAWLLQQENAGRTFATEQLAWLGRIRDHVAASLGITAEDFEYTPFVEHGGLGRAAQVLGPDLGPLLDELNKALAV